MSETNLTTQARCLQAALEYAGYGWPVVSTREKDPGAYVGADWGAKATTDEDTILEWFDGHPEANVGVICGPRSGIVDMGVNGPGGDEVLRRIFGGELPVTLAFGSRRGKHHWFAWREGLPAKARYFIGDGSLELIPGNNLAQVIVPPSVCDGVGRKWLAGCAPNECDLASIPDEALQRLVEWDGLSIEEIRNGGKPRRDNGKPRSDRQRIYEQAQVPEGERDNSIYAEACAMWREQATLRGQKAFACDEAYTTVLRRLVALDDMICKPPLGADAVRKKCDGARAFIAKQTNPKARVEYERLTCKDLAEGDFRVEYLCENIVADQQPGVISGRFKTLKTGTMLALGLSLATGLKFLGKFFVPRPVNVGVFSGESGKGVLQETALRIARSLGVRLADVDRLLISTTLPRIGHLDHQDALERYITDNELAVCFIDPSYLAMPDVADSASNLFAVGALLMSLTELGRRTGCSIWLCAHNKKAKSYEVPELGDIAWSGFAEWARQWLLLGKRREWDPATGRHWLHLVAGGSAGHGGVWGLNVTEGRLCDPEGRRWEVEVMSQSEARDADRDVVDAERAADGDRRMKATVADARNAILKALVTAPDNADTVSGLRARAGHKGKTFDTALAELLQQGELDDCQVKRANGQTYAGYKRRFRDQQHDK